MDTCREQKLRPCGWPAGHLWFVGALVAALAATACSNEIGPANDDPGVVEPETNNSRDDDRAEDREDDDGPTDDMTPATALATCEYVSPFSQSRECREYRGASWTMESAGDDCGVWSGELTPQSTCEDDGRLGVCVVDGDASNELRVVSYGDDDSQCESQTFGCETFAQGTWNPAGLCGPGGNNGPAGTSVFIQPFLECREPLMGEPPGTSPDGEVCTWQAISAATEEGRRFVDYGSCEVVLTQRPYYPRQADDTFPADDERLEDPTYAEELDWVRSQIEASACVCCHSDAAPSGPSNWSIDAPGNWVNTFFDTGLAIGAGWVDSTSFGAFAPEENNGFSRLTGFPTTDEDRMRAFFEAELAFRGKSEADFADTEPFGGPLYGQLIYEPEQCNEGERVDPDGTVHWSGGDARYVYVLEVGSDNPTVPPNLDLPDGTLWRLDVFAEANPLESGDVRYGEVPEGTTQSFPDAGQPPSLTPGTDYYLYVTLDVGIPLTRCLFTYGDDAGSGD